MRTSNELAATNPRAAGADNAQPRIIATAQAAGGFTLRVWDDSLLDGGAAEGFTLRQAGDNTTGAEQGASLDADASTVVLEVAVQGARGLKALLCDVAYDSEQWHALDAEVVPDSAGGSTASDDATSRYLSLAQTAEAGRAYYGLVRRNYSEAAGLEGDAVLLRLHFAAGGAARRVSVAGPPVGADCQAPLSWDAGRGALDWLYYNTGDYDQNGKVGLTDLLPLGLFYGDKAPGGAFAAQTARSVADGNADGWLSVADLVPLSMSWDASCTKYGLYSSLDSADYPASASVPPNPVLLVAEVDFAASQLDPGARRRFSYTPAAAEPGRYYWVRPSDGAASGMPSTLCRVPTQPTPMESAWPMPGHDLQRTSRSEYVGPQTAKLKWTFFDEPQNSDYNGTVFIEDGVGFDRSMGDLKAYYPNGDLKWVCEGISAVADPISGPDGRLYIAGLLGIYCVDNIKGNLCWFLKTPYQPDVRYSSNRLYYTCRDQKLRSVTLNGKPSWEYTFEDKVLSPPTFAKDGTLALVAGDVVYKFSAQGELQWLRNIVWPTELPPAIGEDGSVYVANGRYLIKLGDGGVVEYCYLDPGGWVVNSRPLCWPDGSVCFANSDGVIYAIDPSGKLAWKYDSQLELAIQPCMGPDGRIYLYEYGTLYALASDGKSIQEYDFSQYCCELTDFAVKLNNSELVFNEFYDKIIKGNIFSSSLISGPILSFDGSVVLNTQGNAAQVGYLSMSTVNPAGAKTWEAPDSQSMSWMMLTPSGTLLGTSQLYSEGTITEQNIYGDLVKATSHSSLSGPAIALNGGILLQSWSNISFVDGSGEDAWSLSLSPFYNPGFQPAVNSRDEIYVAEIGHHNDGNTYGQLQKLSADGQVLHTWEFPGCASALLVLDDQRCAVLVDGDEYTPALKYGYLAVYDDDAGQVWRCELPCEPDDNQEFMALDSQGSIYAVVKLSFSMLDSNNQVVYRYPNCIQKYSSAGDLQWQTEEVDDIVADVVLDAQGKCYAICSDGIRAYNPDGTLLWHYLLAAKSSSYARSSSVIGSDGTLYFANNNGKLYAFHD